MKSKNSLCNKAIIKNDFHRFGPLIVICTIFFQLLLVTPLFSKLISVNYETNDFAIRELINTARNLSLPIIPLLAGVIVPMLLFNYINTERETYTIHALPLTRTSLFFSHYVFGLAIIYIPMVLAYMGLIFVNAYFRCHALLGVLGSLLLAIIEYYFFYNMGCMVMMLCGNSVIAFVVHFVLNFIFYALVYLTDNLQLMLPVYSAFTFNVFQKMQLLNPIVFFRKFPVFTSNFYGDPFYTDSFHYKSLLCIAISLIPAVGFLCTSSIIWLMSEV